MSQELSKLVQFKLGKSQASKEFSTEELSKLVKFSLLNVLQELNAQAVGAVLACNFS